MTVLGTTGDGDVLETFRTRVTATVLSRVEGNNEVGFTVVLSTSSKTCQRAVNLLAATSVLAGNGHEPIA